MVALLLLGAAGCGRESVQVRDARDAFFGAMARFDEAGMRAAVTPGYLAVRDSRMLKIDSVVADLESIQQESLTVRYAFADSAVEIDPPMAWLVFHSRRIVRSPTSVDTAFALESALFHRDGAGWRLALLHTTRVGDGERFFEPVQAPAEAPVRPAVPGPRAGTNRSPAKR